MQAVYQKMGDALLSTGRPIVFSLCQYGRADVWNWGAKVDGNLWRTTGDISDHWDSMANIAFKQLAIAPFAKPGHWNDPDMLEVGNGGMTDEEYRTHMALWAMLRAPLLAGNDVRNMTPATKAILLNRDIIAIDQDPLGKPAELAKTEGNVEVWTRPLDHHATALAFFNKSETPAIVKVSWHDLKLKTPARARDLWAGKNVPVSGSGYTAHVPGHGSVVLRLQ
jgi:alpha-galactosidase